MILLLDEMIQSNKYLMSAYYGPEQSLALTELVGWQTREREIGGFPRR